MKKVSTKGLWHVNDNGVVTQCRAENGGCPFAHNGHYATRIDAERMAEEILSGGAEAKTLKNEPSAADAAVSLDDKPAVFNVFKKLFKHDNGSNGGVDPSKRHAPKRFEDVEVKPHSLWDGQLELAEDIKRDPVAAGRAKANECMDAFMNGDVYMQLPEMFHYYYDSWDEPFRAGNVGVSHVTWGDYAVGDAGKVKEYKKSFYDTFVGEAAAGSKNVIDLAGEAIKLKGRNCRTEGFIRDAVADPMIMARSAQLIVSTGRAVFNKNLDSILSRYDSSFELNDNDKMIARYFLNQTEYGPTMYAEMATMAPEDRPHLTDTNDLEQFKTTSDRENTLREKMFDNSYVVDSCCDVPRFSYETTIRDKKNAMLAYVEGWSKYQLAGFKYLSKNIDAGLTEDSVINVEPLFNRLLLLPDEDQEKIKNARVALNFDGMFTNRETTPLRLDRWENKDD